ncbi:DUF6691 family protein [Paracoccus zeaxanthinifaciens]|uniref:DUF6691 family protein n=1 Tax=Paracoccus zeaxanthinifaciens TaxID=187400 RepID=UPI0003B666D8|nr:DUF6691 family protein [Paracoccus zeaxanthinifaciens]
MRFVFSVATGVVFGIGIALSGMMDPAKVLNFFDIAGAWDPSLAFVMGGALAVALPGYRLALRMGGPMLANRFDLPTATRPDARLIGGSAIFGIGWGIAGFCPGAAIPALGTMRWEVALFLSAVIIGFMLRRMAFPAPRPKEIPR